MFEGADFEGFCVGWGKPLSGDNLLKVLKNSYRAIVAIEDDRPVGFVHAISDGQLCAYIPLLEVLPSYQMQGIGSELMKRIFDELKDLYMVDLCCDMSLTDYYERLGMVPVRGMCRRNFEAPILEN